MRRAYCMRPRPQLAHRMETLGLAEDFDFIGQPVVVMTETLPFEGKLEGYRALILRRCKEAFLQEFFEDGPLSDLSLRETLLGEDLVLAEAFDLWWTAEEVETLEIKTTW